MTPDVAFANLRAAMRELLEDEFAQVPEWHETALHAAMEGLRMSLDRSSVRGCTWTIWGNYCRKKTELGRAFCDKHKDKKCVVCLEVAVLGCSKHTGPGICGAPLCLKHKAFHHHER